VDSCTRDRQSAKPRCPPKPHSKSYAALTIRKTAGGIVVGRLHYSVIPSVTRNFSRNGKRGSAKPMLRRLRGTGSRRLWMRRVR